MQICICGKSKPFDLCCGQFLLGKKFAKTPEQLMRSRYSAYALGGHGEYLLATWLPNATYGLNAADLSKKTVDWERLEVISASQKGDKGVVEFKAWFRNAQTSNGLDVMHEISDFVRIQSRWYYVGARNS